MASDRHDGLVRDLRLGKLSDRVVPQIVEPETGQGTFYIADIGLTSLIATTIPRCL